MNSNFFGNGIQDKMHAKTYHDIHHYCVYITIIINIK